MERERVCVAMYEVRVKEDEKEKGGEKAGVTGCVCRFGFGCLTFVSRKNRERRVC
jgi:hypothetical protein